jgi:hypothetical protein
MTPVSLLNVASIPNTRLKSKRVDLNANEAQHTLLSVSSSVYKNASIQYTTNREKNPASRSALQAIEQTASVRIGCTAKNEAPIKEARVDPENRKYRRNDNELEDACNRREIIRYSNAIPVCSIEEVELVCCCCDALLLATKDRLRSELNAKLAVVTGLNEP